MLARHGADGWKSNVIGMVILSIGGGYGRENSHLESSQAEAN